MGRRVYRVIACRVSEPFVRGKMAVFLHLPVACCCKSPAPRAQETINTHGALSRVKSKGDIERRTLESAVAICTAVPLGRRLPRNFL